MCRAAPCLLLVLVGCGTELRAGPDASSGDPTGGEVEGMTRLIGRTWSLAAGEAAHVCARVTIPEDVYVTSFEAQARTGTHHTVLSIAGTEGTAGPDGDHDCSSDAIGAIGLYASGTSLSPLTFPDGIAIKLAAGQQLHLNVHLSNPGDRPLSGETAIWARAQRTPPRMLAELVFAGTYDIAIPPRPTPYHVVGGCTATDNFQIFALWPHMHELGLHQKLQLVHDGRTRTLHDKPFRIAEHNYDRIAPAAEVQAGDTLRVTCTYLNTTDQTVGWGDGEGQEVCFTGMYRYPAVDAGTFSCTGNSPP